MPPLTWRNVDAPSAGDALQGLSLANRSFDGGADALSQALGKFGDAQTLQANNAVTAAALKYQDPNALAQALSSGSILQGIDPSKVSVGTLNGLQSHVGDLLAQASNQENLTEAQYKFGRQQADNTALDAARPVLNELALHSSNNDQPAIKALMADPTKAAALAQVRPDLIQEALTGSQRLAGGNTANEKNFYDYGREVRDDDESRAVSAATADILDRSLGDSGQAYVNLQNAKKNLSPSAGAALSAAVERAIPGTVGSLQSLANQALTNAPIPGSGAGTSNFADATYKNTNVGGPAVSKTSIGDLTKDGGVSDQLMKAAGASPVGAYQINKATLQQYAPKVFGADADKTEFNLQNQDKLAQAIFDDRKKSGTMTDTWPTLAGVAGADKPGGMANVSWDQVRDTIASKESGANPLDLHNQLNNIANIKQTSEQTTASRNAEDLANTFDPKKWQAATQDTGATTSAIGTSLATEKGGELEGTDPNWITNRLDEIRKQSGNKINAAQAGEILRVSLKGGAEGFFKRFYQNHIGLSENDAGTAKNQVIDQNKVSALVDAVQSGKAVTQGVQSNLLAQQNQSLETVQGLVATASQNLIGAQRAVQTGRWTQAQLAPFQAAYDRANAQLQFTLKTAASNAEGIPTDWTKNRSKPTASVPAPSNAAAALAAATQDPRYTLN